MLSFARSSNVESSEDDQNTTNWSINMVVAGTITETQVTANTSKGRLEGAATWKRFLCTIVGTYAVHKKFEKVHELVTKFVSSMASSMEKLLQAITRKDGSTKIFTI